jgi:hypothetical protein
VTYEHRLLILRLTVGLPLAAHGRQKLFGWFGAPGLDSKTVPETEVFMPLGLALTEKQIPQITENKEKPK